MRGTRSLPLALLSPLLLWFTLSATAGDGGCPATHLATHLASAATDRVAAPALPPMPCDAQPACAAGHCGACPPLALVAQAAPNPASAAGREPAAEEGHHTPLHNGAPPAPPPRLG